MAWFDLHYPAIIQPREEPPKGVWIVHLRWFEGSLWEWSYVAALRKLLCHHNVYNMFQCFSYIRDASYGEEFKNIKDGRNY